LLLDVELPDGDGVAFCAETVKTYPGLKIIMLTGHKEFNIAKHALHNGALGYILKNAGSKEVFEGIETVGRGKQFLCEEINRLFENNSDTNVIWLSEREKEILKYISCGYTVKEIATLMSSKIDTIKTHRKNLFAKVNAKNMAELIKKGSEMMLI